MSEGITVDFGDALADNTELATKVAQAADLQPEPPAPTSTALATKATEIVAASSSTPGSAQNALTAFVCRDMLTPEDRAKAEAAARSYYPGLLADPNALGNFGNKAVEDMKVMVHRMLKESGRAANIPELTAVTRDLDRKMRAFNGKYDYVAREKNTEQYDKIKSRVLGMFRKGGDMLHELLRDAKGIQAYLDSLSADLIEQRNQLAKNVILCNQLYDENEKSINKLVAAIAVMEYVRDVAEEAARAIQPEGKPNDRELREDRDEILEFIQAMDVRIGEFKQRLFVAYATGPQIRKIRAISYGLGQRLALLVNLTIPVFELTIVQWVALEQANQAGQTSEAVGNATDAALTSWANAAGELVPRVAKQIQTPSMHASTIAVVAESLAKQAEGVEEAFRFGTQARGEINAAIVQANNSMAETSDKHARNMLQLVTDAQKPFALPAGPSLPKEITDRADDVFSGL